MFDKSRIKGQLKQWIIIKWKLLLNVRQAINVVRLPFMMSDCVMKLGPGGWVRSPRMVEVEEVEVVEGVALSGRRKRKGKEEMAVTTGTLVTSERRKGGNDSLQGWVDLPPGTTTVNQGTQRPQEYSTYVYVRLGCHLPYYFVSDIKLVFIQLLILWLVVMLSPL